MRLDLNICGRIIRFVFELYLFDKAGQEVRGFPTPRFEALESIYII